MKKNPQPRRHLRRHRDDDYVDHVEIQASTGAHLVGFMVPRYKTSGLSGDEWRVSAHLEARRHPKSGPVVERTFHRMGGIRPGLVHYGPYFLFKGAPELLTSPNATLTVRRKGHVLMVQTFPTFGEAAMGLDWHICVGNEGTSGVEWTHLSDEMEATVCQQVGCAEPPVNVFRLKKLFYGDSDAERCFLPPKYDFEGQWAWYCARHTERGDCGIEDASKNLELVDGPGIAKPRAGDFSPSGLVVLGDEGDD